MPRPKVLTVMLFLLAFGIRLPDGLYAEDVKISNYYPSPYGNYKQVQVQNGDENTDITKFTQSLIQSGLNLITDYTDGSYTPGIFWSTQNENSDKPKAGIWMYEATAGTKLFFGTSNNYATGITSNGLVLDQNGNIGIGTDSPNASAVLELNSTTKGFLPPRMATAPTCNAAREGMMIYNTTTNRLEVCNGTNFTAPSSGAIAQVNQPTTDCRLGVQADRFSAPKCGSGQYVKALTKYTESAGAWARPFEGFGCICCAVGNSVASSYNTVADACVAELTAGTIIDLGANGKMGTAKAGSTFGHAGKTLTCPARDP